MNKLLEQIASYVIGFASFSTFIYLVVFQGWAWQWVFVGIFMMYLLYAMPKVQMDDVVKKDNKEE
jgi:hypothetical protein